MSITLTFDQAVEDMRKVVAERGEDYVYQAPSDEGGCVYFEVPFDEYSGYDYSQAVPSCAVGCILDKEGLPVQELVENGENEDTSVQMLLDATLIAPDPRTRRFLAVLQERQDRRRPYGEVFRHALTAALNVDLPEQGYNLTGKPGVWL